MRRLACLIGLLIWLAAPCLAADSETSPENFPTQPPPAADTGEKPPEIEFGYGREWLTGGLSDWSEYYVDGAKTFARNTAIYGTARRTERFDLDDTELIVGGYLPLGAKVTLNPQASVSSGRVLPQFSGGLNANFALQDGWGIGVGYLNRSYSTVDVHSEQLTLQRYFGSYRAAYTLTLSQGVGSTAAHALNLGWYYTDRSSATLVFSTGQELEAVGFGRVLQSDVLAGAIYGQHWVNNDWAVTYTVGLHDQKPLYTKRQLRLGLRHSF